MELTEEEFAQIEKYIRGTLSEEERKVVEDRMQEEPLFLKKFQYQKGIRDFFEARYDEQVFLQILDENNDIKKSKRGRGRVRQLVITYWPSVAMGVLIIGIGIGWLLPRTDGTLKEGLMLSRSISRTIYPDPNSGFADNGPTTGNIVIQVYQDQEFDNNTLYYRNDTLTLYNVHPEIRKSSSLGLTHKDQKIRLQADKETYQLTIGEDGKGSLDAVKPKSDRK